MDRVETADALGVETADAIGRLLVDDRVVAAADSQVDAFAELVAMEQEWAAREHRHGVIAEELADRDAAGGNLGTEDLHRRQALAHQRAATIHEHAAELYRRRIARLESERPIPIAGRARGMSGALTVNPAGCIGRSAGGSSLP